MRLLVFRGRPSMRPTADALFADPRLAAVYDLLDPDRSDLGAYAAMVTEFGARAVLDIGCGTGTFACMLAGGGIEVTGLGPAAASLEVARGKPGAEQVRWVHGDVTSLPPLRVDLATMTGNVAQVFLTDNEDWVAAATRYSRISACLYTGFPPDPLLRRQEADLFHKSGCIPVVRLAADLADV